MRYSETTFPAAYVFGQFINRVEHKLAARLARRSENRLPWRRSTEARRCWWTWKTVAPEIRARLFEPFVSAGKRNGPGLGLALSRQTVLDHGGDMWVGSAPGRGARFSFPLPGAAGA